MKRADLEHVLRAAGAIAGAKELVVIGSQAVLAWSDCLPAELLVSNKADVYPRHAPQLADLIDGSIGELSPFHEAFGYYAHGVGPETAILPAHWESRLIAHHNENTGGVTGWCLHPEDLAMSRLAAGRPKDLEYVRTLLRHGIVRRQRLEELAAEPSLASAKARLPLLDR